MQCCKLNDVVLTDGWPRSVTDCTTGGLAVPSRVPRRLLSHETTLCTVTLMRGLQARICEPWSDESYTRKVSLLFLFFSFSFSKELAKVRAIHSAILSQHFLHDFVGRKIQNSASFSEVFKNLAKCRFENNFIGFLK